MEDIVLPEDDETTTENFPARSQFEVIDGALHQVEQDKTLQIFSPTNDHHKIMVALLADTYERTKYMDSWPGNTGGHECGQIFVSGAEHV